MVSHSDLPPTEPRWSAQQITVAEVLRLWRAEAVARVSEADPRVQAIRACRLSNYERLAIAEALREGYIYVLLALQDPEVAHNLRTLWGGWCAAAGHPEIVMSTARAPDVVRVHCDLAPTGRSRGFDTFRTIARPLGDQQPVDRAGWLFAPDEVEVEWLEMEEAITVARDLVDVPPPAASGCRTCRRRPSRRCIRRASRTRPGWNGRISKRALGSSGHQSPLRLGVTVTWLTGL